MSGTTRSNHTRKNVDSGGLLRRRDLEDDDAAARAARRAPSRRRPRSRSEKLRAPKPTVAASKRVVVVGQLERVAPLEAQARAPCARASASISSEKSEPTTSPPGADAAGQLDRQVAGAGRDVEHARRPARPPRGPRRARASGGAGPPS